MIDADHGVVGDLVEDGRELGQASTGTSVRTVGPDGLEQIRQLPEQAAVAGDGVAQGEQDLLLAAGPGEVALACALRERDVGERLRCRRGGAARPAIEALRLP